MTCQYHPFAHAVDKACGSRYGGSQGSFDVGSVGTEGGVGAEVRVERNDSGLWCGVEHPAHARTFDKSFFKAFHPFAGGVRLTEQAERRGHKGFVGQGVSHAGLPQEFFQIFGVVGDSAVEAAPGECVDIKVAYSVAGQVRSLLLAQSGGLVGHGAVEEVACTVQQAGGAVVGGKGLQAGQHHGYVRRDRRGPRHAFEPRPRAVGVLQGSKAVERGIAGE